MSRVIGELLSRPGAVGQAIADGLSSNVFSRATANRNLFELGRRLREQDDLADMPPIRRRRITRGGRRRYLRRSTRRSAKGRVISSADGKVSSMGYKRRKVSPRTYRKYLWQSTLFAQHWRSINTLEFNMAPSNVGTTAAITTPNIIGDAFWSTAGGFTGTGTFNDTGAFTVRGGMCKLHLHNDMTDPVIVTVYKMYFFSEADSGAFPATVDSAWDPTYLAGFNRDFKVLYSREFNMREQDVVTVPHKIRPFRTTQDDWNAGNKKLFWCIKIYNPSGTTGGNVRCHNSHNLSFSGDHN